MTDYFKIERVKEDIPFYNGIPKLSAVGWIALIAGFLIYFLLNRMHIILGEIFTLFGPLLIVLIPILYVCRGNYSLLFKRITKKDIAPIIIFTLLGLIYTLVALGIIGVTGIIQLEKIGFNFDEFIIKAGFLVFPLFGEELFKIITLILSMSLLYRFSQNRKVILAVSIIITSAMFGIIHEGTSSTLIKVLLIQGVATVFDMMLYLNTKNIFATYLSHLIFDFIPLSLMSLNLSV